MSVDVPPQLQSTPSTSQVGSWYSKFKDSIWGFFRWLFDWTFAAKVAWVVFLLLLVIVCVFWMVLWNRNNVPWFDSLAAERYETVALVLIIPFLVYRMVGSWTKGVESSQPDIKSAWDRATKDLAAAGISISETPIYLVVGSNGGRLEQSMMDGLDRSFSVRPEGSDSLPLHVYADQNAIYVYCTDCAWTSEIARRLEIGAVMRINPEPKVESVAQTTADQPGMASIGFDELMRLEEQAARTPGGSFDSIDFSVGRAAMTETVSTVMAADETANQLKRLNYICRVIQSVRDPLCPINGILVLSPFKILERSNAEVEQFHRAIRADLLTIQQSVMLKAPVVAMFYGLERMRGFQELARRIGKQGTETRRFGMGFELRASATVTELQQYAVHLTGVFEDWIYKLFCAEDALTHPGNNLLYELLSTIRTRLKTHIANILSLGFGHDPRDARPDDTIRFGGCYFAATGNRPDSKAFFKAAFAKLESTQEEVEWTATALRRQRTFSRSIMLAVTILIAAAIALLVMFYQTR